MRFKPRTLVDTSKKDTRKKAEDSEGLDLGTVCTSDDPRRGGKTKAIIPAPSDPEISKKVVKSGMMSATPVTHIITNDLIMIFLSLV